MRFVTQISTIIAVSALGGSIADAKRHIATIKCWTIPEITAAKLNELSIKLNVASLRCRTTDPTILNKYDDFTRVTSGPIKQVSKIVKGHFANSAKLYDNYAISVANKYGAGVGGESCGQIASLMDSGISTGSTTSGLSAVAEMANISPLLAGGACPVKRLAPFIAKRAVHHSKHHK